MRRLAFAVALVGGAASGAPPTDETHALPFAAFEAPRGWTLSGAARCRTISPPEGDAHILLAPAEGREAAEAIDQAWRRCAAAPGGARLQLMPRPGRDGWDEAADASYDTPPNAHSNVTASAYRHGAAWVVALTAGNAATQEKRAAGFNLVLGSLRPPGYVEESFAGRPAHRLDAGRIAALTGFVRAAMAHLHIPGVGLALVDRGQVVFEGGLGRRSIETGAPVDAHTRFMIASNTKSMTTLLLASLVDRGKLGWDQPVTQAYPAFRLGSAAATRATLIRHLVCACTGMPRNDMVWFFNTRPTDPPAIAFDRLARTLPTSRFGEIFQYNNEMAAAAGFIAAHIAAPDLDLRSGYRVAMERNVFRPLGMTDTTFDMAAALSADHAVPHGQTPDDQTVPASMDVNMLEAPDEPAGGAWSTPHDMALYVLNELRAGRGADGRPIFSAANLLARRAPGVEIAENIHYGMGLVIDGRRGVEVVKHSGSLIGFKSGFWVLPAQGVGAVLLTNAQDGGLLLGPFQRRLLEVLFDARPEAEADLLAAAASATADRAETRKMLTLPAAPAAAAALAARYANDQLGHIDVRRSGGTVLFDFGAWRSEVASRRNADGTVSFVTVAPDTDGFAFTAGDGEARSRLTLRDGQHAFTYRAISQ